MDCAPNHDHFTQILHNRCYVGDDAHIEYVSMQPRDAVEDIPSRPEAGDVPCFEGGLRFAIIDFSFATTNRLSEELRTGDIYHMGPGSSLQINHMYYA